MSAAACNRVFSRSSWPSWRSASTVAAASPGGRSGGATLNGCVGCGGGPSGVLTAAAPSCSPSCEALRLLGASGGSEALPKKGLSKAIVAAGCALPAGELGLPAPCGRCCCWWWGCCRGCCCWPAPAPAAATACANCPAASPAWPGCATPTACSKVSKCTSCCAACSNCPRAAAACCSSCDVSAVTPGSPPPCCCCSSSASWLRVATACAPPGLPGCVWCPGCCACCCGCCCCGCCCCCCCPCCCACCGCCCRCCCCAAGDSSDPLDVALSASRNCKQGDQRRQQQG